jgi:two-component system chemotaxis response regulator CheB
VPNDAHAGRPIISHHIVVIGTSAGGISALRQIAAALPADFPGSVFIVMHLPGESLDILPHVLSEAGPLSASNAHDRQLIEPGRIYLAPPARHLILERSRVRLTFGPRENRFRPAIDPLFRSAAVAFGPRVVGVVLTGFLDDGTVGLAAIKKVGGIAIVQDPLEAEAASMPRSALRNVKIDYCLRLAEIGPKLVELATTPAAIGEEFQERTMPKDLKIETEIAANNSAASMRVRELGEPSIFTCPECHGNLIRLRDRSPERFRHTGHAFSPDSLDVALAENVEDALWNSVRVLQEQAMLLNHLTEHTGSDKEREAELHRRSRDALRRADLVRQALLATVPETPTEAAAAVTVDAVVSTETVD